MASSLSSGRIELLSKDNYDTWCMQVEALLIKNDLWGYVDGTIVKPEEGTVTAKAEWHDMDRKAKADLILSIQPSELKQIRSCETSRALWQKLKSVYASKGPARKATLLKQLMLQKLDEGGDVKDHLASFFDIIDRLENMEVSINGDLLTIMLLYSLPTSFEGFRCAIETQDKLPTPEELRVKIIERSEADRLGSGNNVIALAADQYKKNKEKTMKNKRILKCFKCGMPGHKAFSCPKRKFDKTRERQKSTNNTNESFVVNHTVNDMVSNVCETKINGNNGWLLDSGCTTHLCGDRASFVFMNKSEKVRVNLASNACAEVKGKGTVLLSVASNNGHRLIELKNTLYVPDLRTNLISVAKITNKGYKVIFRNEGAYVRDKFGNLSMVAERRGDLYYVQENFECAEAVVQPVNSELMKWHERLGHLNTQDLMKLVHAHTLPKINVKDARQLLHCEVCLKGKMTALPFPKDRVPCEEILKIVHSDIVGPFRMESMRRSKYFVTFIDDSTRWCEVYFLRQKCDVLHAFKLYQKLVEKQTGMKVKCLQSDNGREYCNAEFDKYLAFQGIHRRLTIPHTPQQNGVAERMNRTLMDMARCLLLQSGLGASFWSEAVATACYIRNRCPTSSLGGQIPYEKWTGKKVNINYFRKFGSKAIMLDKNPNKDKLAQRSVQGVFVGYPRERKGFRVWIPNTRQILESRDVKFLEEPRNILRDDRVLDELSTLTGDAEVKENNYLKFVEFSPHSNKVNNNSQYERVTSEKITESEDMTIKTPGRPRLLRTGSRGRPKKLFQTRIVTTSNSDEDQVNENVTDSDDNIFVGVAEVTVNDALKSDARDEWMDAIESEFKSLVKNDTWDIVQRNDCQNVVGCRLVLTNKYGFDGRIERRKARLVAKGYSQRYGVDYHQTFAPVARLETLRLLLALAIHFDLKIWQYDVVTAYLNGSLEENVIMRMPEMLNEMLQRIISKEKKTSEVGTHARKMLENISNGGNVCKLKKALYGLKQAGRQWYSRLCMKLVNMGLKPTKNEPCLFYNVNKNEKLFVLVYVDDILVASCDPNSIMEIKQKLQEDFEIKDLGPVKYCLGLEIDQNENYVKLSQTGYILGLLKQYGMDKCNPVVTPSEVNLIFDNTSTKRLCEDCPYRELIGALMYLSVATRPDIANTVSRLAQFVEKPHHGYWLAAKRVLRYLAGTADIGLIYTKTTRPLIGYSDSDWGGCTLDRRSYTGYVFLLSGAALTWKSQKQRTVALSSTEAEYVSLAETAKEAIYLRSLLCELKLDDWSRMTIYTDNHGAQCLANDSVYHARTKHINIKYHFIREAIANEMFIVKHLSTKDMVADILTKPLVRVNHNRCLNGLGLKMKNYC